MQNSIRDAVAELLPEIAEADLQIKTITKLRKQPTWFAVIPADLFWMLVPTLERRKVWPADLLEQVQAAQSAFETTYAAIRNRLSLTRYATAHPHEAVEHRSMIHVKQPYGICRIAEHWLPLYCLTIGTGLVHCAIHLRNFGFEQPSPLHILPCGLVIFSTINSYVLIRPSSLAFVKIVDMYYFADSLIDDFGLHTPFPKNSGGFNPHSMFESMYIADRYIL